MDFGAAIDCSFSILTVAGVYYILATFTQFKKDMKVIFSFFISLRNREVEEEAEVQPKVLGVQITREELGNFDHEWYKLS